MTRHIRRMVTTGLGVFMLCGAPVFHDVRPGDCSPLSTRSISLEELRPRNHVPRDDYSAWNEASAWESLRIDDEEENAKPRRSGSATRGERQQDLSPSSFDDLVARARAAMAAERLTEAIRLYSQAVRRRPNWAEGWWFLGTLNFDTKHFTEARDAFVRFVEVERRQPGPGFGMLGLSEFHLRHYPQALAAFERGIELGLGTDPPFIHAVLFHDGILNNLIGLPEIALTRLTLVANQIAAAHPQDAKQAVLGDSELLDAFGLAALRIAKLPSDISGAQAPLLRQAGHAQALIALQDRVTAGDELKELVALYPSEPGVHYMYGVYLLKENPPLALDEFRRELQISPSSAVAHIQLALEYLRLGEYDQGLVEARKSVALVPGNFIAHVAYGRLLLKSGKTDPAVEELRTAVKLAPGSPDAHFALSQALTQAGRSAEAATERAAFERLKAMKDASNQSQ